MHNTSSEAKYEQNVCCLLDLILDGARLNDSFSGSCGKPFKKKKKVVFWLTIATFSFETELGALPVFFSSSLCN